MAGPTDAVEASSEMQASSSDATNVCLSLGTANSVLPDTNMTSPLHTRVQSPSLPSESTVPRRDWPSLLLFGDHDATMVRAHFTVTHRSLRLTCIQLDAQHQQKRDQSGSPERASISFGSWQDQPSRERGSDDPTSSELAVDSYLRADNVDQVRTRTNNPYSRGSSDEAIVRPSTVWRTLCSHRILSPPCRTKYPTA